MRDLSLKEVLDQIAVTHSVAHDAANCRACKLKTQIEKDPKSLMLFLLASVDSALLLTFLCNCIIAAQEIGEKDALEELAKV